MSKTKVKWAPSMSTWIDELLAAGVEDGDGKKATREALERLANDYTGEFMMLYGELKAQQSSATSDDLLG